MARKVYARRYAQAIFDIARETNELDRWQSDLEKIVGLGEDATLRAFWESPKFRFEEKTRLLSEQLSDAGPLALNLACLLVTRGRLGMIGDIAEEYRSLLNDYYGIEQAEVITAVPLDDEERLKLAEQLSRVVDKKVVLETEVDPEVIGGVIIRIGGKLIDGSIRNKLAVLKQGLVGGGV